MKSSISWLTKASLAAVAAITALNAPISNASAQGTAFSYQGRLTEGTNPASGRYNFVFSLFPTNSGGTAVGGQITNSSVAVSNGLFTIALDFGADVFTGASYWLEIGVNAGSNAWGTFTVLTPRQPLSPVPYAAFASLASNVSGTISATQLNGTIPNAALPSNPIFSGTVTANWVSSGGFSGNGNGLTGLNPANLGSGTAGINISGSAVTATTATNVISGVSLTNAFLTGAFVTNSFITNSTFAGNGSGLTGLNASQLAGGTVPLARLSGLTGNQLDTATWQLATNVDGGNSAMASNVVAGISITNGALTGAYLTNAFITNSIIAGSGVNVTSLNPANLSAGTAGINISGSAVTATTATNVISGVSLTNAFLTGAFVTNSFITNSTFAGNGSGLTGFNASQLAGGTVPLARLSGLTANQLDTATWQLATNLNGGNAALASNVLAGISLTNAFLTGATLTNAFITNSIFAGDGSGLVNLNAGQLAAGVLTNNQSEVTFNGLTTVSNLSVTATNFVNYLVVTNPPALDGSAITALNANNLSSGTVPLARLNSLTSKQLDTATWQLATNVDGGNAALASNVVSGVTLTNAFLTGATLTNAFITNSIFAGDGSGLVNLNAGQLAAGVLTNNQSEVTFNGLTTVSNLSVTATNFVNYLVVTNPPALDGSAITALNANNLSSGTVPLARLNSLTSKQLDTATWQLATNVDGGNAALASNVVSGVTLTNAFLTGATLTNAFITNSIFAGDGSGLVNLNAGQLAAGVLTNNQSEVTFNGLTTVSNLSVTATNFVNYLVVTNPPALNGSAITALNANNLSGGTVPLARLSGITSNQLDTATWQLATNVDGGNAALASNVVAGVTLTNAFLTGATLTNAFITNSIFAGDGSGLVNLNAGQLAAGVLTNNQSDVSFNGLTTVSNLSVTATNFVNYLVVTNPPALNGSAITALNANNLSSGTMPLARLSGLTSNQLDTATWQLATNVNGGNAALASNVVAGISLTNAFLTGATLTNAFITNSIFAGNGGGLTNLNANNLSGGTVPLARLSSLTSNQLDTATWQLATNVNGGNAALASNVVAGINLTNAFLTGATLTNAFITNSIFAGNGGGLTNLNANNLSSGTVPLARLSGLTSNQLDTATWQLATNLNGGNTALASNVVAGINLTNAFLTGATLTNAFITNSIFAGNGGGLTNLNANNLSSGTVPLARLSGLTSNQLDTATWQLATNLNGGNAALASNMIAGINLTNAFLTGATLTNAFITNSIFAGNGGGLSNLNAAQLTIGVIPVPQLPPVVVTNAETGITLTFSNLSVTTTNVIAPLTVSPKIPNAAIGSLPVTANPTSIAVAGRYVYLTTAAGLQIVDASIPSGPVMVGSLSGSTFVSVAAAGRYAYVLGAAAGLQVVDVSNPSNPRMVGSVSIGPGPGSVAVAGRYAYVVGAAGMQVVDVGNPASPAVISTLPSISGPAIAVAGRYVYAVAGSGVIAVDVSDPFNPLVAGSTPVGSVVSPNFVAVAGRYVYVAGGSELDVIDVSNPNNMQVTGSLPVTGNAVSDAVAGRYAYVVNLSANALQVVDVSNPYGPVSVGVAPTATGPTAVAVSGRYAYVANRTAGTLQVFDLGGAYVQHLEAGTIETGTLQSRDTLTVGNGLDVRGGLTVGGSARVSGGLSVDNGAIMATNFVGNGTGLTNIFHVTQSSATSGSVVVATNYQSETTYLSSAPIASMTIVLPANPVPGQVFFIHSRSAVVSLSVSGGGFVDAPVTSLAAGQTIGYQAVNATGLYLRLQ